MPSTEFIRKVRPLLQQWPRDNFRPSMQLSDVYKNEAGDGSKEMTPHESQQVKALSKIAASRYLAQYPLTTKTTQPLSNPEYYTDIVAKIRPASASRSFWSKLREGMRWTN